MAALLSELVVLDGQPLEDVLDGIVLASVVPRWAQAVCDVAAGRGIPLVEATR